MLMNRILNKVKKLKGYLHNYYRIHKALLFVLSYLSLYNLISVETLKTSKSVGDLMTEIQKETETMMLETDKDKKRNTKESSLKKPRAFSQTPPPSKSKCKENESKM